MDIMDTQDWIKMMISATKNGQVDALCMSSADIS